MRADQSSADSPDAPPGGGSSRGAGSGVTTEATGATGGFSGVTSAAGGSAGGEVVSSGFSSTGACPAAAGR